MSIVINFKWFGECTCGGSQNLIIHLRIARQKQFCWRSVGLLMNARNSWNQFKMRNNFLNYYSFYLKGNLKVMLGSAFLRARRGNDTNLESHPNLTSVEELNISATHKAQKA
jgi:hypothetical protein